MADPRTFTLIGNFQDNITPSLGKINNSISRLKANLADLSNATKPLRNDFKELTSLSKDFNTSIKGQSADIRQMTTALRSFRSELGKVNRAYRAGGNRMMRQAAAPPVPPMPPTPRAPRAARLSEYAPTRERGGYAAAVGGGILGTQLANTISGAIVSGFNIGTQMMMKPFEYFQKALGERIADEMSDLKAAGGYFAVAKRQKDPFVTTMDEAIAYTQKNNLVLAKLAAALPGSTQDYVEVSKRLSDTITRVVSKDLSGAIKEANRIRMTDEGAKFYGPQIKETAGRKATQDAITTLLGEMTKKTVLAGFGGRAGAGGSMGPYGLPGLTERLISQEQVSVSQFQRYAAIFSDPQILDALTRNIGKVNATAKDSIARYKALDALYNEILPPELIEKFRRSVKGINEALYSAAMNPEVGFLGIGRKMEGLGRAINDFGQYVDETGKVVTDVNSAAKVNLSIYDMLRDIYAQTAQVLVPVVEYLPELWDPLRKIGEALKEARHYTAEFLRTFNSYREGLKQYAQTLDPKAQFKVLESLNIRASLAAINNLFAQFGVYGKDADKEFSKVALMLKDPNLNVGNLLSQMIDKLFKSDVAKKVGEFLGNLIGTILKQVADATKYISGIVEGGGFAGGFASAFSKAGGFQAIQDIFLSIAQLFIKALVTAFTKMPLLSLTVTGLALLPAIIGAAITAMVEGALAKCSAMVSGGACPMPGGRRGRSGRGGMGGGMMGGDFFQTPAMRRRQLRMMARARRLGKTAKEVGGFGTEAAGLAYNVAGRPGARAFGKIGGAIGKVGKFIPGGALAAGAVDMGVALASGENFGKAAAGAIGTVLGGAVGSIFGPAGTMIGSIAGGMIGDAAATAITGAFNGPSDAQREAARAQLFAAQAMKGVAPVSGKDIGPAAEYLGTGVVGLSQLQKAIQYAGLAGNQATKAYMEQANTLVALRTRYKELNDEAYRQKQLAGGRVSTQLQAQLEAARKTLAAEETKTSAAWAKITATNKAKINNAIVQLQTNTKAFNQAITVQAATIATTLRNATAQINAAKLTPETVESLSRTLPAAPTKSTPTLQPTKKQSGNWFTNLFSSDPNRYAGGLGDAVAAELKNKPPGSDLIVANTSETVIPAAGGYGMLDFVETLRIGFNTLVATFTRAQQAQTTSLNKINQTLVTNQQQTNIRLATLEKKFTTPVGGALGGGSMGGGVDAFTPIAQRFGLQMTSGYRPGDPGWHGANRARDFSNGTGPTPQMMQFAQYMASTYGANLKELIYSPLGYSIKNGQRVPPYAVGSHYNHVHVAYAGGPGMPAFFSNQKDAVKWEQKFSPFGAKSITSNTAELGDLIAEVRYGMGKPPGGGMANWMKILDDDYKRNLNKPIPGGPVRNSGRGGLDMWEGPGAAYMSPRGMYTGGVASAASSPINITAPITINQQPGQNADELASIVAIKIGEAVADARAASIFV